MLELIFFVIGSAALIYISRASLRSPKSHGFHRFFAWELMLLLVLLNKDGWQDATLTPTPTVSGILIHVSLFLALTGYLSLRWFGQQDDGRNDTLLMTFEKTTVLVTRGIYRYIRHPMYSSLIFLDWGLFFMQKSWLSGGIALVAGVFLVFAALAEESENTRYFGMQYQEYMKRTKRFMPFLL